MVEIPAIGDAKWGVEEATDPCVPVGAAACCGSACGPLTLAEGPPVPPLTAAGAAGGRGDEAKAETPLTTPTAEEEEDVVDKGTGTCPDPLETPTVCDVPAEGATGKGGRKEGTGAGVDEEDEGAAADTGFETAGAPVVAAPFEPLKLEDLLASRALNLGEVAGDEGLDIASEFYVGEIDGRQRRRRKLGFVARDFETEVVASVTSDTLENRKRAS